MIVTLMRSMSAGEGGCGSEGEEQVVRMVKGELLGHKLLRFSSTT